MIIYNKSKKTILSKNAILAKSLTDKTIGLIKYNKPQALIFNTRFGIHTFFMKFSIDILILDKNNRVVKLEENLPKNNLYFWNPAYSKIIELPSGTIKKSKTKLGDKIDFKK